MTIVTAYVTAFLYKILLNLGVAVTATTRVIPEQTTDQFAVVFESEPENVKRLWKDRTLAYQDAVALANAYGRVTLVRPVTLKMHELKIGAQGA